MINNLTLPQAHGLPYVGEKLTVNGGTWEATAGESVAQIKAILVAYQDDPTPMEEKTFAYGESVEFDILPAYAGKNMSVLIGVVDDPEGTFNQRQAIWEDVTPVSDIVLISDPLPVNDDGGVPFIAAIADEASGKSFVAGSKFSAYNGVWTSSAVTDGAIPEIDFSFKWFADDEEIETSLGLIDFVSSLYGKAVRCEITATALHRTAVKSTNTINVPEAAHFVQPVNTVSPALTGLFKVGGTITVDPGTWTGEPATFTYQWYRGDEAVDGATNDNYIIGQGEIGLEMYCEVTAIGNGLENGNALSNVVLIATAAPSNDTLPVVQGEVIVGNTLVVDNGTWQEAEDYAYQWLRDGEEVDGADDNTYVLTIDDLGKMMSCVVTASNSEGSTNATSAPVGPVVEPELESIDAPALTGDVAVGGSVSVTNGTWNGSVQSYTYQWMVGESAVSGAISATFTPQIAHYNKSLSCIVTAHRGVEQGSASTASQTVAAGAFVSMTPPSIGDAAYIGEPIEVVPGQYNITPIEITYQWTVNSVVVSGNTSDTYTPTVDDLGKTIIVTEIAKDYADRTLSTPSASIAVNNDYSVAISDEEGPVVFDMHYTTAPEITGDAAVGSMLTVSDGVWNLPVDHYTYQWMHDGIDIADATNNTYTLVAADLGKSVSVHVVAHYDDTYFADFTTPGVTVQLGLPVNTVLPVITAPVQANTKAIASHGEWTNTPDSYSYEWSIYGVPVATTGVGEYMLPDDDVIVGKPLTVKVTATNATGSGEATSAAVQIDAAPIVPPSIIRNAAISGDPNVESVLTLDSGEWAGDDLVFSIQWFADDVAIAGASGATLTLTQDQLGKEITAKVTATNGAGSLVSTSNALGPIEPKPLFPPVLDTAPIISGTPEVGQTLTYTAGVWTGDDVTVTHVWQADDEDIADSEDQVTLELTEALLGKTITVVETAANDDGEDQATSNGLGPVVAKPLFPPVNTKAPVIAGTPQPGQSLFYTAGTWTGDDVTVTFVWQEDGVDITGSANKPDLTVVEGQIGKTIRVQETATNPDGSETAVSNSLGPVEPVPLQPPVSVQAPFIEGRPNVGDTLQCTKGVWSGTVDTTGFAWYADNVLIEGSNDQLTLELLPEHLNKMIKVVEFATNEDGTVEETSNILGPIGTKIYEAPVNKTLPSITGTPNVEQTLLHVAGEWEGEDVVVSFIWKSDGQVIAGTANQSTFVPSAAYEGKTITITETATNPGNATDATSADFGPLGPRIYELPVNTAVPTIAGKPNVNETLTYGAGTWTGEEVTVSYVWKLDGVALEATANAPTIEVLESYLGKMLTVTETATNPAGQVDATSAEFGPIEERLKIPPANTAKPQITGTLEVGNEIDVSDGQWTGDVGAFLYQWMQDGIDITGATSNALSLDKTLYGKTIGCRVTAVAFVGNNVTVTATGGGIVTAGSFDVINKPVIQGQPYVGQTLSFTPATWTIEPESIVVQWLRNNAVIEGATAATHALDGYDANTTITVSITAKDFLNREKTTVSDGVYVSNDYSVAISDPVGPVTSDFPEEGTVVSTNCDGMTLVKEIADGEGGTYEERTDNSAQCGYVDPPVNTTPPSIQGKPEIGETVNANPGVWENDPAFTYVWRLDGEVIVGATTSSLAITEDMLDKVLVVEVTATTTGGVLAVESEPFGPIHEAWPEEGTVLGTECDGYNLMNIVADGTGGTRLELKEANSTLCGFVPLPEVQQEPSIAGTAQVTQTLTVDPGDWSNNPTFTYQWLMDGQVIAGATAATLELTESMFGKMVSCRVTATTMAGSIDATTDDVGPVAAAPVTPPVNDSKPVVNGTVEVGETLTASPGTWTGDGLVYTYQWKADGQDISGATGTSLALGIALVDKLISVQVTATNIAGAIQAESESVGPVSLNINNVTAPVISGTPQPGQVLTTTNGTWDFTVTSYSYQWKADGVSIVGATNATYTVVKANIDKNIVCEVSAHYNDDYFATALSNALKVEQSKPAIQEPPVIEGDAHIGLTVQATTGVWDNDPDSFEYTWFLGGIQQAETSAFFEIPDDDALIGKKIKCVVKAINETGFSTADTAEVEITAIPTQAPSNTTPPSISGTPEVGQVLTADPGVWEGDGITFTYQWKVDGFDAADGNGSTFTPIAQMAGKMITVVVTATNSAGAINATSAPVGPVAPKPVVPPSNTDKPKITGEAVTTRTLTVSNGTWEGDSLEFTYQWLMDGSPITGATSNTYVPTNTAVGKTISCRVTATNSAASLSAVSDPVGPIEPLLPKNVTPPIVTGTARVNETLTATMGVWEDADNAIFTYQWFADGQPIAGATATTFKITDAQLDKPITVVVTATVAAGATPAESLPTPPVQGTFPPAGTELSTHCAGTTKVRIMADGRGGSYPVYIPRSEDCGYVPVPSTTVDELIEKYRNSENETLKSLANVLACYRDWMGYTKPCNAETIHELQLRLWATLRAAVFEEDAFRDAMDFILAVFRENRDGAFELHMVLRTVDMVGTRLFGDQRDAYVGLMNVYCWAGRLNDVKEVKNKVDLQEAVSAKIFSPEARMRLIGYFD